MIILNLKGGLGNQMFQYSFGRNLQETLNTELKFDVKFLNENLKLQGGDARNYELCMFNIRENFASNEELMIFKNFKKYPYTKNKYIRKILTILRHHFGVYLMFDNSFVDEALFGNRIIKPSKFSNNLYIEGYWAKTVYIKSIWNYLKEEFSFKKPIAKDLIIPLKHISETNSVSIHVRRGDYITDLKANKIFGVLDVSYYYNAINHLINRLEIKNPVFYVFSDDINWCKKNLNLNKYDHYFVENNFGKRNLEFDFRLMKSCKHNIIANSTFSWWAAFLNDNKDKIVIAPRIWYAEDKKQINFERGDFIPDSWTKI